MVFLNILANFVFILYRQIKPGSMYRLRFPIRAPITIQTFSAKSSQFVRSSRRPSPAERPRLQHLPLQERPIQVHPLPAAHLSERSRPRQTFTFLPATSAGATARRSGPTTRRIPRAERRHQMLLGVLQPDPTETGIGRGLARGGSEPVEEHPIGGRRKLATGSRENEENRATG